MRLTTFAATALLTLLTVVSPAYADAVGDVRVDNTMPSAAAGARTVYSVSFTTSQAGALSGKDQIHVTLPAGTGKDFWQSGTVRVGSSDVGTCAVPNADLTSTCGLFSGASIKAGTQVVLILRGLVNGTAVKDKTVRVDTTKDSSAISKPFEIVEGGAVSQPAVDISSPSAAAGARTRYVVGFKLSGTGGLSAEAGSEIEVRLPPGTGTDGWVGGTVHDVTRDVDVGTCGKPADLRLPHSTCGFFSSASVAPGDELRITLRGLTNGGDPGAETVTVSTTSDLPPQTSSGFEIGKGQQITQPSVAIDDPSAAGGARTRYVVDFKLSSSGGMSAEAGSEITLTLPPGTGSSGWIGGTVHDVTAKRDVGTCVKPDAKLVSTCGFFSASSVAAGDELQLILRGLENGDPGTGKTVTVSTTSDLPIVTSSGFEIVKGAAVSTPTVSIADPSAAAGARTRYVIGFTLSPTGGMSAEANSRITLALPGDTGTDGWLGGTVRDVTAGGGDVGSCDKPDGQGVTSCGFFSGRSVAPDHKLEITLRGLTNGAAGSRKSVQVWTSSDLPPQSSTGFEIVGGGAISTPTVAIDDPSPAAGARTRYVIGFTLSATGGMSADANSRITLTLPGDTGTGGWLGGIVRDVTRDRDVGSCSKPDGQLVSTCTFFSGNFANAGDDLRITLSGLANGSAGARKTLTVSTTSDLPERAASGFDVVPGNALTGVTVTVGSTAPLASTQYTVELTTSATGGLSADANSRVTLTFPAGTGFVGFQSGALLDVDRGLNVGSCGSPSGPVITCTLFSGAFVTAGDSLRISFPTITNPPSAGPYALTASTTSDIPDVTSSPYATPAPPQTTIDDGPSGAIDDSTPTFRFSSSTSGATFECRVDDAAFAGCSSPHTTPTLADGPHTFEVRATSPAGVVDPTPASQTFTVDTHAPASPAITAPDDGSAQNTATVELSGTAEPGATIAVREAAASRGTTTADGAGNWTLELTSVPEGTHAYTATATDSAGNTSEPSAPRTITVDLTAPATPVITDPADGSAQNTQAIELSGTGEAGVRIDILEGSATRATAVPDGDGHWSHTLTSVPEGTHVYTARATDAAGNLSPDSAPRTIIVDLTAPAAPVITAPEQDAVLSTSAVTLEGTAEAGTTVVIREDGEVQATALAEDGTWSAGLSVANGAHSYTATAADLAGNESPPSAPRTFTVDTGAPDAPVIIAPPDGSAQNTATVELSGTAEPGSTVEILEGDTTRGTTTADGTGTWSHELASVAEGTHTYTATATDAAGNTSPPSAPRTITVDLTAPAAPVITAPDDGTAQNTRTIELSGTAEPNARVELREGDQPIGGATAGDDGKWAHELASVPEGAHTYAALAIDAAGNPSPSSAPVTVTVDLTAPAAPVITAPEQDAQLSTATVTFHGTAEAGSSVEIREGDDVRATVDAEDGTWSAELSIAEGTHAYTATAKDLAGNDSPPSAPRTITVDTQVPEPTIDDGPSGETTETTASFAFSAEDGTAFECRLEGPAGSADFAACTSPRSFDGLTPGNYTFFVRATDAAGNETTRSRAFSVAPTQQPSPPDQPPPPPPTPTPAPTPTVTPTPTPTFQQTVVAEPVRGTVRVKLRGSKRFVELDATQGVPFGATIDTKKGAIELTSLSKAGAAPQTATFSKGIFKVTQKGAYTNLTLNERMACGKRAKGKAKASAASKKKRKVRKRRLWGSGKGKFRTVGRYSAATVRGTNWRVEDTCSKTVTRVKQGVVSVRDKVKHKTITLRKGKSYTARKRR